MLKKKPEPKLSVVCVQVGNYLGHGPEYVYRLRAAVLANLKVPYRFYVITDDAASEYPAARVKPADKRLPGWWQKLAIFKPGMFSTERVLFLDLDTHIAGRLEFLAEYQGEFATLHDFWRPEGLGPAVMAFRNGAGAHVWENFEAAGFPVEDPRGDQWWLEEQFKGKRPDILQDLFPGRFVSYKTHCTRGIPADASVVCFHGKPRPHEVGGIYWS